MYMPAPEAVLDYAQGHVTAHRLSVHTPDNLHQFRNLAALIGLVAAVDRVFHAMAHMILEDLFLHAAQRGAHRRDLGHDVDAVAVLLHHLGEATHLTFDAAKPLLD